jgi:hypothetical protein
MALNTDNIIILFIITYLLLNVIDCVQTRKLFEISEQAESNILLKLIHRYFGMIGIWLFKLFLCGVVIIFALSIGGIFGLILLIVLNIFYLFVVVWNAKALSSD